MDSNVVTRLRMAKSALEDEGCDELAFVCEHAAIRLEYLEHRADIRREIARLRYTIICATVFLALVL